MFSHRKLFDPRWMSTSLESKKKQSSDVGVVVHQEVSGRFDAAPFSKMTNYAP
jgi:hypothetical protein